MTDPLTQLAQKYRTDKWGKHHYTPIYYELFRDKRLTTKKFLEIGVGEGAGLKTFAEFFPNASIYGAEIDPQRVWREDRIQIFLCDQSSTSDLESLIQKTGPDIDLVIEDGSHLPMHQITTCRTLMPLLKKDVIYIIEDVANPEIMDQLKDFDCNLITVGTRYDDRLLSIRNKV